MKNHNIDKLRKIFLSDETDEETRQDNLKQITEFENGLARSSALKDWQNHEITHEIISFLKAQLGKISVTLGTNSELDEKARTLLFANRTAILWLLSVVNEDPEMEYQRINAEINKAIENVES